MIGLSIINIRSFCNYVTGGFCVTEAKFVFTVCVSFQCLVGLTLLAPIFSPGVATNPQQQQPYHSPSGQFTRESQGIFTHAHVRHYLFV